MEIGISAGAFSIAAQKMRIPWASRTHFVNTLPIANRLLVPPTGR